MKTSVDEAEMNGVEYLANTIHTVREDFPLREAPGFLKLLALLLVPAVPALLFGRFHAVVATIGVVLAGVGYLGVNQLFFNAGEIMAVFAPMVGLAAAGIAGMGSAYMYEALERQRARDTFSRFVSPAVVDEVMAMSDGIRLGGRRYDVTVLFSDIRGFTTFSESRPPEEVLKILNRYLGGP